MVSFAENFSVSANVCHEFVMGAKVFNSDYTVADFGVNWSATLSNRGARAAYNPPNALVRFEFLELVVRMAKVAS